MGNHRRDRSPVKAMWAVAGTAALALGVAATASFASDGPHNHGDHPGLHALTRNPDCTLKVPANPLSARGLATPYVLSSAGMTCSEHDEATAAFVQATILDPATGKVTVYNPAVVNPGDKITPPPVTLPKGAVVTVWTGFNSNVLKLTGPGHKSFVNFAQQSYANSPAFFAALNSNPKVTPQPLGQDTNGNPCPTSRDWAVVDQDQSDNVPVSYPAYGTSNGSDEGLLQNIDAALGCQTWQAPDAVTGKLEPDGALQEAQAAAEQAAPQALVPSLDPFVLNGNGQPSLALQNLYRAQVDQAPSAGNDTAAYCTSLATLGVQGLKADYALEAKAPAPQFAQIAGNLGDVLKLRFEATWKNLQCSPATPPY